MNKEVEKLKEMLKSLETEVNNSEVLIKADKKHCEIKGTKTEVLAVLSGIIEAMHNEMGIDKETFNYAVDLAFGNDFENDEELEKEKKEFLSNLDKLSDLIRGMLDE